MDVCAAGGWVGWIRVIGRAWCAEASKAQATSKKRAKRKARKKKAQKALAVEEAAASSDEEAPMATPPTTGGRGADAPPPSAAPSRGGAAEGSGATLDTEAATAAAVAAIAQSGGPVTPHDSPLMAMLEALDEPVQEEWQQVRVRTQKHGHRAASKSRDGSGRSDSARAQTVVAAHAPAPDSHRGGRRGRLPVRSRTQGLEAAASEDSGGDGSARHPADGAASHRSSAAHAPRAVPSPARQAAAGPYAVAAAGAAAPAAVREHDLGDASMHAWGAEEWPELPGAPVPAGSGLSDQTAVGAATGATAMDSGSSLPAPPVQPHGSLLPELSPRLGSVGVSAVPGLGLAPVPESGVGGDRGATHTIAAPPHSGSGLTALPGWSSFGLAGLDSMPLAGASSAGPSMPVLNPQPGWQPTGAVPEHAWATLQPALVWPQAPLPMGQHAGGAGEAGAVLDLHVPPAKSLGTRVSEALSNMHGGLASSDGDLQPDFESIVRQAGVDDDDATPVGAAGVPLLEMNEASRMPEWAAGDLQRTMLGSLSGGRFSMF